MLYSSNPQISLMIGWLSVTSRRIITLCRLVITLVITLYRSSSSRRFHFRNRTCMELLINKRKKKFRYVSNEAFPPNSFNELSKNFQRPTSTKKENRRKRKNKQVEIRQNTKSKHTHKHQEKIKWINCH